MAELTENKIIYNDFKFFKGIYTQLNTGEYIYLTGIDNTIKIQYNKISEYFILRGELFGDIELFKWLKKGKTVKLFIKDLVLLGKVLKKNAISIQYSEENFIYKFLDKDGIETEIKLTSIPELKENKINYIYKFALDEVFIKDDLCRIYFNNGKLTTERSPDKIIEIPTNKLSLVKNGVNEILFTEKNNETRYVAINSKNDNIELTQEFLTI